MVIDPFWFGVGVGALCVMIASAAIIIYACMRVSGDISEREE